MWIVKLALRRPYTFIVMALLILLATPFVLRSTPVDIFPEIKIPVVSVIWTYNGMPAEEVGQRIAAVSERGLTTTVNNIEHIEFLTVHIALIVAHVHSFPDVGQIKGRNRISPLPVSRPTTAVSKHS